MQNTFDRIKVYDNDFLHSKVDSLFNKTYYPDSTELMKEEYSSIGLQITHLRKQNRLKIDISAKLLGKDYQCGINANNIALVHEKLYEVVQIPFDYFIALEPHYCECKTDLVETNIDEAIDSLFHLSKLQIDYTPSFKPYKRNGKKTSFFIQKAVISPTSKEYLSIYNKWNELNDVRKKENLKFLDSLGYVKKEEVLQHFNSIMRIESKFQSKAKIKWILGLNKNCTIQQLLNSDKNINHEFLERTYKTSTLNLKEFEGYITSDFDKLSTLKQYKNDLDKIYEQHRLFGNSRQRSKVIGLYKKVLEKRMLKEDNDKINKVKNIIEKTKW